MRLAAAAGSDVGTATAGAAFAPMPTATGAEGDGGKMIRGASMTISMGIAVS